MHVRTVIHSLLPLWLAPYKIPLSYYFLVNIRCIFCRNLIRNPFSSMFYVFSGKMSYCLIFSPKFLKNKVRGCGTTFALNCNPQRRLLLIARATIILKFACVFLLACATGRARNQPLNCQAFHKKQFQYDTRTIYRQG